MKKDTDGEISLIWRWPENGGYYRHDFLNDAHYGVPVGHDLILILRVESYVAKVSWSS